MLVLSRKLDSVVHIGPQIKVNILSIKRHAVKLGIEAPESVRVWRDEVDVDEFQELPAAMESSKRILLADDDAGHVTLIKRALRRANIRCAVDVVHNGVEAINYLFGLGDFADRQPLAMPDLMLLDLNMPEMNGLQVLQVLRSTRSRGSEQLTIPPVVILSSSDQDTDINDSYDLGARSFIRKPVDHGQFAHAVQQTTQYWLGLNESLSEQPSRRMSVPR